MLFSRPRSLNGRWVCLALSLAGAGALSASGAMDDGPSISQLTMDSNQMQVTVSYPSSQIQNRWNVYSRSVMDGADTGAWTLAGTSLVLTGGVCTSWSALLMPNQYFAMGDQGLDSDGDGLSDAYEQLVSHTDPMRADTDGDGVSDGDEVSLYGTDPLNAASHPTQTILRASGKLIVDGSGAPILLRGMNMGGWLSYEQWMVQFQPTNYATDDYTVRATLDGRFGATGTVYLLDIFRDHYFTAADLDELKAAGCNFLRVPFPANLLEDDTNTYHYMDSGWARLDWVVAGCAARHMYCLLDLHGVQGSQNPWDHSGRQNYDQLWFNTDFQNRAVAMWGAIAQRYATNAAVAGYDLMNEPYVSNTNQYLFFTNNILPLYDRMYRAIRAQDSQHLVFVQSTEQLVGSNGACWWMPNPAAIGWSNVVYEFHHYDGIIGSWDADFSYQKSIAD